MHDETVAWASNDIADRWFVKIVGGEATIADDLTPEETRYTLEQVLANLLARQAEIARLQSVSDDPRTRDGYSTCYRCHRGCGMDATVSNEVWAQISPTGGFGGMLCPWCMDELCVERGIKPFVPVELSFAGKVLVGSIAGPML